MCHFSALLWILHPVAMGRSVVASINCPCLSKYALERPFYVNSERADRRKGLFTSNNNRAACGLTITSC